MNAPKELAGVVNCALERSTTYRLLAQGFTYAGAQQAPFHIAGTEFNAAFDPSVCETGCSLREGLYTEEDQSSVFEELMRFYSFFGLQRGEGAEMPDHLSVELEFMHYLTHLESEATLEPEALASLHRAQHDFLTRHLQRVVRGLAAALQSQEPACVQLVQTCVAWLDDELAYTQTLVNE